MFGGEFGVEFQALAAFGVDAVAAILGAGLLAPRHHYRAVSLGIDHVLWQVQLAVGCASAGNILAPWGSDRYTCPVGAVSSMVPSGNCCSHQPGINVLIT